MNAEVMRIYDRIAKRAQELASDKEAAPFLFSIKGSAMLMIPLVYEEENKQLVFHKLKVMLKDLVKPEAIITVTEARLWKIKKEDIEGFDWEDRSNIPFDDVLVVTLFTKKETVTRTWKITKKKEKRVLSDYEETTLKPEEQDGLMVFTSVLAEEEERPNYIG